MLVDRHNAWEQRQSSSSSSFRQPTPLTTQLQPPRSSDGNSPGAITPISSTSSTSTPSSHRSRTSGSAHGHRARTPSPLRNSMDIEAARRAREDAMARDESRRREEDRSRYGPARLEGSTSMTQQDWARAEQMRKDRERAVAASREQEVVRRQQEEMRKQEEEMRRRVEEKRRQEQDGIARRQQESDAAARAARQGTPSNSTGGGTRLAMPQPAATLAMPQPASSSPISAPLLQMPLESPSRCVFGPVGCDEISGLTHDWNDVFRVPDGAPRPARTYVPHHPSCLMSFPHLLIDHSQTCSSPHNYDVSSTNEYGLCSVSFSHVTTSEDARLHAITGINVQTITDATSRELVVVCSTPLPWRRAIVLDIWTVCKPPAKTVYACTNPTSIPHTSLSISPSPASCCSPTFTPSTVTRAQSSSSGLRSHPNQQRRSRQSQLETCQLPSRVFEQVPLHCRREHFNESGDLWALVREGQGVEVCGHHALDSKATFDERYLYDGRGRISHDVYGGEVIDHIRMGTSTIFPPFFVFFVVGCGAEALVVGIIDSYASHAVMLHEFGGPAYPFRLPTDATRVLCRRLCTEVDAQVSTAHPSYTAIVILISLYQLWYLPINRSPGFDYNLGLQRERSFPPTSQRSHLYCECSFILYCDLPVNLMMYTTLGRRQGARTDQRSYP